MLTHWKLTLSYDGTDFHGWQIQPELRTIQGVLSDTIASITGERILPQGSGRTDAGVHALGQVASFSLHTPIPQDNLLRALNRSLPSSIRALAAEHVPPDFHARHSVIDKTYQYRIFHRDSQSTERPICPPFLARYVYTCPWTLDLSAMQHAAQFVLGEHDFSSFAASDPDRTARENLSGAGDTTRTICESAWSQDDPSPSAPVLLRYTVRGNGFLHHMVRNLVGTFLEIGRGQGISGDIPGILAARDRSQAGPTAPASGLFLMNVSYLGNPAS